MQVKIKFMSLDDVKYFVTISNSFEFELDLKQGRQTVDAKSILGVFSLDLSNPVILETSDENNTEELCKRIEKYII